MRSNLWPLVLHLRLPFQAALSVPFLWGVFVSSGRFGFGTWVGYLAFAIALSGGATAFNSYYDRDRGPVGGLRNPPAVTPALLPFSLGLQAVGWLVAACLSARLGLLYLVAALLFAMYSHPAVRIKKYPWVSLATVSVASGALMLLAGAWAAADGPEGDSRLRVGAGMAAASLAIAGFYPLTQLGQIGEDRARGDRTFAIAHGRRGSFLWCLPMLTASATTNVILAVPLVGWAPASALALALASIAFQILRWRRDPILDSSAQSDLLVYLTAGSYLVLVVYRAIHA